MFYELKVAGLTRQLPIVAVSEELAIASFVMLGDCEMVTAAAPLVAQRLPEVDYLVTAEAKGIPLVQEMARVMGMKTYIVARKSEKAYMENTISSTLVSITTQKPQTLYLDGKDGALLKGKRVAVVDDVISTGESLRALEELMKACGANVVAKAAVLAEDKAADRDDIIFLGKLPLFNAKTGEIL
ncbi:MAG: adenine phosphoribosyltransferase [Firmicutes bacterium]|nr:adenine phosphoribosyltransferase [Bacillota bacterium]